VTLQSSLTMSAPNERDIYQNISALNNVLNKIDSVTVKKKKKLEVIGVVVESTESSNNESVSETAAEGPSTTKTDFISTLWYEYLDPGTGKPYYHNVTTNQTSWEKPTHFIPAATAASTSTASAGSYRSVGYFSSQNGRYTKPIGHMFDKVKNDDLKNN
jgi:hypothetical protein